MINSLFLVSEHILFNLILNIGLEKYILFGMQVRSWWLKLLSQYVSQKIIIIFIINILVMQTLWDNDKYTTWVASKVHPFLNRFFPGSIVWHFTRSIMTTNIIYLQYTHVSIWDLCMWALCCSRCKKCSSLSSLPQFFVAQYKLILVFCPIQYCQTKTNCLHLSVNSGAKFYLFLFD